MSAAETTTEVVKNRKEFIGFVKSNKMDKTIVVEIMTPKKDKLYQKYVKKTKSVVAHDEKNEANIGDKVKVIQTRPISKRKRWRIIQIIEKAKTLE